MPLPEGYLPREGDELLIRVNVRFDVKLGEKVVHTEVVCADHYRPIVPINEVHDLYCRYWNEGERVIDEDGIPGTVVSTNLEYVWVYRDAIADDPADMFTYRANELRPELAPAAAAPEAPPKAGVDAARPVEMPPASVIE